MFVGYIFHNVDKPLNNFNVIKYQQEVNKQFDSGLNPDTQTLILLTHSVCPSLQV